MISSSRKNTLSSFLKEVWTDGQVQKVDDYLAEKYTIHHDPGDPWEGNTLSIDGFKERLCKSRSLAPDQCFTIVTMIEEGSSIAVAWTWQGTHLGCTPEFPATGKPIKMSGLTIYEFEGNRISGHWQVADRLSVFQQLSLQ